MLYTQRNDAYMVLQNVIMVIVIMCHEMTIMLKYMISLTLSDSAMMNWYYTLNFLVVVLPDGGMSVICQIYVSVNCIMNVVVTLLA